MAQTGSCFNQEVCRQGFALKHGVLIIQKELSRVHVEYLKAGADIIYTFTFGGSRPKLKQYGITDVYNTNKKLAEIARNAIGKRHFPCR